MPARPRTALAALLVLLAGLAWGLYRWWRLSGHPWPAGHPCTTLVTCADGLCLVHERIQPSGSLTVSTGYCSQRCSGDADCPAPMRCEALPQGISRAAGDHLPVIALPERLCVRFRVSDGGR